MKTGHYSSMPHPQQLADKVVTEANQSDENAVFRLTDSWHKYFVLDRDIVTLNAAV